VALNLLRDWSERESLIRCYFSFIRFACCFRARIRVLLPERIEFLSDDTRTELSLPLAEDLEFGIGDFATESPDDAATYGRCLAIFIPVPNDPEHPETL